MRLVITILLLTFGLSVKSQQVVTICPNDNSNSTFTYYSQSNSNGTWVWLLGNDTLSQTNNVTITWDSVGSYNLILNFYGECSFIPDTYKIYVVQCLQSAIYFPTAFSPNGDGKNDTWKPEGFGVKEMRWFIFDRWGLQIFEANGVNDEWDGCMEHDGKRNPVQSDVYVWLVNWKDSDEKFNSRTGRVTLIR